MSNYDNNLTGALFKVDQKKSDRHPDYNGSCEINGTEFWVSGWIKQSKAGKAFMSLSFTAKEQQSAPVQQPVQQSQPQRGGIDLDDVPFAPIW